MTSLISPSSYPHNSGWKIVAAANGSWNVKSQPLVNHSSAIRATTGNGGGVNRRRTSAAGILHCKVTFQPDADVRRWAGAVDHRGRDRIDQAIPFRLRVVAEKHPGHADHRLEQRRNLRVDGKQEGDVGKRADRQQGNFARPGADRLTEEINRGVRRPLLALRKIADELKLRHVRLTGPDPKDIGRPAMNRHITAIERPADDVRARRSPGDIAGNGGDAEQLATRLLQQIRQGNGVVDVAADVGVEDDGYVLGHLGRAILPSILFRTQLMQNQTLLRKAGWRNVYLRFAHGVLLKWAGGTFAEDFMNWLHAVAMAVLVESIFLCGSRIARADTEPSLQVGFDDKGLSSVRFGGAEILQPGEMELPRLDLRRGYPPERSLAPTGEPEVSFDAAARRLTQAYPWGALSCTYRVDGNRLLLDVEIRDTSKDSIFGFTAQPLQLRLPGEVKTKGWAHHWPSPSVLNDAPQILNVSWPGGAMAICNEQVDLPLWLNLERVQDSDRYNLVFRHDGPRAAGGSAATAIHAGFPFPSALAPKEAHRWNWRRTSISASASVIHPR